MERLLRGWLVLLVALAVGACDGDDDEMDAGLDAGGGGEDAAMEEDAGTSDDIALDGLDGPVDVTIDDRGVPHIYGTTRHDVLMVQGYLMARDRFAQIELIRRQVLGKLAEVLATLDPSVIEDDRDSRFLGFGRWGRDIYESLPADDRTRLVAEAFVAGINAYIDEVVLADDFVAPDGLELLNALRASPDFGHWDPADIFALARFQSWNLSYDAGADVSRTEALMGVRAAFDPGDTDERLAARAGIYADFWSERQARDVYTRDSFNDGSTTAFRPDLPDPRRPLAPPAYALPSRETLAAGRRFFDRLDANPLFRRDPHIGSNSWVVSGDHTESGQPILSNDPHLSLIAPPIWWYVHLNTARMGGEDDMDVQGVAFAGLPGVVLGYNRDLAWSATTTGYDVTDVYQENVTFRNDGTPSEPAWVPVSVEFDGGQVALETVTEEIRIAGDDPETLVIPVVPHHGPLIPDSIVVPDVADPPAGAMEVGSALSVRYTGQEVSNELAFFTDLQTAETIDDAFAAADAFEVGAQNFSFVSADGHIAWTTSSRIPQRSAAACSFSIDEDGIVSGASPLFVLPGQGGFEWEEDLDQAYVPHDVDPARGYIATANQANVPVTRDGNPCDDAHYLGGDFAVGYRMGRIVERLDAMVAEGGITTEDMIELQAETRSSLGETMRDPIVASLDHALGDPSDDPALDAAVTDAGADGVADLTAVRDRLTAWSFATPHGVGATDADEIAESVATTIFNATITRLTGLAFQDEADLIGRRPGSGEAARMLEWSLMDAADQQALPLYTYREDYAGVSGYADSVVWDDLTTETVVETRDERVVQAVLAAVAWLEDNLGDDWDEWRWGRLHAVRFEQVVPPVADPGIVSIPPVGSDEFPIGFPRHGDYGAVDVGNYSMWNGERFTHGSGASQRLVVEMTTDGPVPFNALPGGQVEDPSSPHHDDEAQLWIENEQPPMHFEQADIDANAEDTLRFVP
ncbi:MAG TPA: penicillin acylase family protein [Sandaracinaceae bacterium LLY-WYZ-13_1]|nr:penicillin acylase family protein [Sandaracinaceae bacterium LLY-WYZ-13_1]